MTNDKAEEIIARFFKKKDGDLLYEALVSLAEYYRDRQLNLLDGILEDIPKETVKLIEIKSNRKLCNEMIRCFNNLKAESPSYDNQD